MERYQSNTCIISRCVHKCCSSQQWGSQEQGIELRHPAPKLLSFKLLFTRLVNLTTDESQHHCDCYCIKYDQVNLHVKVWHCPCCEEFCMCKKCKELGMHAKHFVHWKYTEEDISCCMWYLGWWKDEYITWLQRINITKWTVYNVNKHSSMRASSLRFSSI